MSEENLADVAAERAVLAGLCQYGKDSYIDISDIISMDTLTIDSNKIIYKCISHTLKDNEQVDLPSILAAANELGLYDAVQQKSEVDYIRSLFNFPIHIENVRTHARKLAKLEITRKLQIEIKKIFGSLNSVTGSESVDHILSLAQKPILDFGNSLGDEDKPVLIGKDLREYVEWLKANPNRPAGISSGFTRFDAAIGGGFRRKTISLIGARMKVGKSILADNVAIHVAGRLGIPVLMLDTEMSTKDHQNRLLAYHTKIPIDILEESRFGGNPILEEKLNKAVTRIEQIPYTYKNVSGKGFEEILAIIHRWIVRDVGLDATGAVNHCLVVYDYFKLMTSESIAGNMQEFQILGFQISELHNFCVKYDFPVLSFVQLNRDGITGESTDVVSQSDRLLWLCTNFSIFKDKTIEEIIDDGEEFGNKKLIPLVARHGKCLKQGDYINMSMQGQYAMLEEMRLKSELFQEKKKKSGFEVEDDDNDQ